jgi:hypothetical protein
MFIFICFNHKIYFYLFTFFVEEEACNGKVPQAHVYQNAVLMSLLPYFSFSTTFSSFL